MGSLVGLDLDPRVTIGPLVRMSIHAGVVAISATPIMPVLSLSHCGGGSRGNLVTKSHSLGIQYTILISNRSHKQAIVHALSALPEHLIAGLQRWIGSKLTSQNY